MEIIKLKITKKLSTIFSFITASALLLSFTFPDNWIKTGSKPNSYEMGNDKSNNYKRLPTATIKSIKDNINGFGSFAQYMKPDKYIGKRVRMSGFIKSKNVIDWAGFWFRVDQDSTKEVLAFDNMYDRAVKGTTNWTKYNLVLDIPIKSSKFIFGALINGTGQIWFTEPVFEVVDNSVNPTGIANHKKSLPYYKPVNIDFKKEIIINK